MKLLHWNVHMWRDAAGANNRDRVADLLAHESPDVVSLVEVDEPWGRPEGIHNLADDLGYRSVFIPAFEYRCQGGFGNALLIRSDVHAVQQWQLLSPRLYTGDEQSEPRAVVLAFVGTAEHGCWVGSTHLPRSDPEARAEAAGRLLEILDRLSSPWVLCGDFNQLPTDWLRAAHTVSPSPPQPTYPSADPTEAIDYCVLAGTSAEAHVVFSDASDHLPVVVTVSTSG